MSISQNKPVTADIKADITADTVYQWIKELTGGYMNAKEDIITFGRSDSPVKKIVVCWMADAEAIQYAASAGADLMIVHESVFFPYGALHAGEAPEFMTWHINVNRIRLLAQNNICLMRVHYPLDKHCIFDTFAAQLGLGEPAVVNDFTMKVYDIEPVRYAELIERVKSSMNMPVLRVSNGDPGRIVKRVGLPWGGLGLAGNAKYMQSLLDLGCDVFIAGETDNYGIRFAIDSGVDIIETGHEVSENNGLRKFACELGEHFNEIPVVFYENKIPFRYT